MYLRQRRSIIDQGTLGKSIRIDRKLDSILHIEKLEEIGFVKPGKVAFRSFNKKNSRWI